ncbi:hypothetical protein BDW71DRAFT_2744 [Aspergillus fruticulosus]
MSKTLSARSGRVDLFDPGTWTSPAGSSSKPGAKELSELTLLFPPQPAERAAVHHGLQPRPDAPQTLFASIYRSLPPLLPGRLLNRLRQLATLLVTSHHSQLTTESCIYTTAHIASVSRLTATRPIIRAAPRSFHSRPPAWSGLPAVWFWDTTTPCHPHFSDSLAIQLHFPLVFADRLL